MDTGRDGDQAADTGDDAADEDRDVPEPVEPVQGTVDVLALGEPHLLGDRAEPVGADHGTQPVQQPGTDHRTGGGPGERRERVHVPLGGREAGERQDHLAGDRGEDRLDEDRQADAGGADGLHERDEPVEHGGDHRGPFGG